MQGFLFSCPPAVGPGRSLVVPGPVVVACEPLPMSGQRVLFSRPLGGNGWDAPAPFRVMLLYEDKAEGSAPARLARLARHHGLSFVHERFEVLDGPGRGSWEVVWVF
jgi:hypothetical protein